jgi:hypothetical protein
MSLAVRILPEAVRTLGFASIGATYMGVGNDVNRPVRILHIQNLTDAILMFSFDGIEDHFPLAANGYLLLDITANKTLDQGFFLAEGQRIYVKEIDTPSSGSVYVTVFYGADI